MRSEDGDNEGLGYVCEDEQGHSAGARMGTGMRCFPRGVVWFGWVGWSEIWMPRGVSWARGRGGGVINAFFSLFFPNKICSSRVQECNRMVYGKGEVAFWDLESWSVTRGGLEGAPDSLEWFVGREGEAKADLSELCCCRLSTSSCSSRESCSIDWLTYGVLLHRRDA